jgi:UDP-N-acetylglucosamine 1-carboxyvinyltransferase
MSVWKIQGGHPLSGSVRVQGSKNAVLPILAATMLTGCETELLNCPRLRDVEASLHILRHLGCQVDFSGDVIQVDSRGVVGSTVPYELTGELRSSVIFLGAILGRCGQAHLSMPGGCELGPRPIDLHLAAMEALGAKVENRGGEIVCSCAKLVGNTIHLPLPSVGATENAMIAACAAQGKTVIVNAAREPEIVDLQNFLCALGANIQGAGEPIITVEGFQPKTHVGYRVMPDRIWASTVLCACASAGGHVCLQGMEPSHVAAVTEELRAMGCHLQAGAHTLEMFCPAALTAGRTVITRPYPGFPTDAQPLLMAASLKAQGTTVFVENMFDSRYRQAQEMLRLGADIRTEGRVAIVTGVPTLRGAPVLAEDLRGGAALIVAGLGAEGQTLVTDHGHVVRGYEGLENTLCSLGAVLEKTEN